MISDERHSRRFAGRDVIYDGSLDAAELAGGRRDSLWFLGGRPEAAGLEDAVWTIGAHLASVAVLGYLSSLIRDLAARRSSFADPHTASPYPQREATIHCLPASTRGCWIGHEW